MVGSKLCRKWYRRILSKDRIKLHDDLKYQIQYQGYCMMDDDLSDRNISL